MLRQPWVVAMVLWCAVLGSAAAAVSPGIARASCLYELERLHRERDRLDITWGQLQAEQSTFSAHANVEATARARAQHEHSGRGKDPAGDAVSRAPANDPASFRLRAWFVFGVLMLAAGGLLARAVELQLIDREFLISRVMRVSRAR